MVNLGTLAEDLSLLTRTPFIHENGTVRTTQEMSDTSLILFRRLFERTGILFGREVEGSPIYTLSTNSLGGNLGAVAKKVSQEVRTDKKRVAALGKAKSELERITGLNFTEADGVLVTDGTRSPIGQEGIQAEITSERFDLLNRAGVQHSLNNGQIVVLEADAHKIKANVPPGRHVKALANKNEAAIGAINEADIGVTRSPRPRG